MLILLSILQAQTTAPEFSIETFEGKKIMSTTLLEKGAIFLDFWSTSCEPCLKALPKISELAVKYQDVNFIGVNTDLAKHKDNAKKLIKSKKYKFTAANDTNKTLQNLFNVRAIPRTIIIDKDGTIVYDNNSYTPGDEVKYEKIIQSLINREK
jgi:thiol-disulfide isomerase/thioredoxin